MNIQIFGTKKCNDTKKAERFFKERGIKYQFIDMKEKGMNKANIAAIFIDVHANTEFHFILILAMISITALCLYR